MLNVSRVHEVTRATWSVVRPLIQQYVERRQATHPDRSPNVRRKAVELTVWQLARDGRLRDEEDQALWDAVRDFWEEYEPDPEEPVEVRLWEAWQKASLVARQGEELMGVVNGC